MSAPILSSQLGPASPEARARAAQRGALARAARVAFVCAAAGLLLPAPVSAAGSPSNAAVADPVRAIFAAHDCCGRLAHSRITRIGELRSGSHELTVYALWFVNPQSRHGMMHLAIAEGRRFLGSYIISGRLVPSVAGNRVRFGCRDGAGCPALLGDLVIKNGILPRRLWVDGDVNELDDSI